MLFSIIKNALSNAIAVSLMIIDQGSFFRVCYSQGGSELMETLKSSTVWEPDNANVNGSISIIIFANFIAVL